MADPLALRLFDWNENIVVFGAVLLNGILLYLTITEKNKTLRSYNRMLCFSSVLDIIYCLVLRILSMVVILKGEVFIEVSRGPIRHLPFVSTTAIAFMQVFAVGMETCVAPVDYFYRYALLCRKSKLSITSLIATMSLCAIPVGLTTCLFTYGFWSRSSPAARQPYEYLLREEGILENNKTLPFSVALASDPAILIAVLNVIIIESFSGFACVWFGYKTYRELNSMKDHISAKTLRIQRKMTWILIGKVLLPLFLISIPTSLIVISIAVRWEIPHLGVLLSAILHYIPMVSPLTTLIFITNYRRRIRNTANRYLRPWRSAIAEESAGTSVQRTPAKSSGFSTVSRVSRPLGSRNSEL